MAVLTIPEAARHRAPAARASAAEILESPLPAARWWALVTLHARSFHAYHHVARELAPLGIAAPSTACGIYELDPAAEPMHDAQALAILDRFARLEVGGVASGVALYPLHWDVLAAHFAPARERYAALGHLVRARALAEDPEGEAYTPTGDLRWPLRLTEEGHRELRRLRLRVATPTLARLERGVQDVLDTYPRLLQMVGSVALGATVAELGRRLLDAWRV